MHLMPKTFTKSLFLSFLYSWVELTVDDHNKHQCYEVKKEDESIEYGDCPELSIWQAERADVIVLFYEILSVYLERNVGRNGDDWQNDENRSHLACTWVLNFHKNVVSISIFKINVNASLLTLLGRFATPADITHHSK